MGHHGTGVQLSASNTRPRPQLVCGVELRVAGDSLVPTAKFCGLLALPVAATLSAANTLAVISSASTTFAVEQLDS